MYLLEYDRLHSKNCVDMSLVRTKKDDHTHFRVLYGSKLMQINNPMNASTFKNMTKVVRLRWQNRHSHCRFQVVLKPALTLTVSGIDSF